MAADWFTANRRRIIQFLLIAVVILMVFFAKDALLSTIKPFFYALIMAYLFNPLVNYAQNRGVKRWVLSLSIVLFILLLLVIFAFLLLPSIVKDAMELIKRLPTVIAGLRTDLMELLEKINSSVLAGTGTLDTKGIVDEITSHGYRILMDMLTSLVSSLSGLRNVLLVPIIMFYMLKDKEFFINELRICFKPAQWKNAQEMWKNINQVLGGFVRGRFIIITYVGIATGVGAAVIGIPNAITIGLLAGVFDLIPYFGPWIGGILPVVLALISPTPTNAIWMVLWMVMVQQLEASVLAPRIIASGVGIHPLLVMFSVMLFGTLFGVLGMIIGVPVVASGLALIRHFWAKAKKSENNAIIRPRP